MSVHEFRGISVVIVLLLVIVFLLVLVLAVLVLVLTFKKKGVGGLGAALLNPPHTSGVLGVILAKLNGHLNPEYFCTLTGTASSADPAS